MQEKTAVNRPTTSAIKSQNMDKKRDKIKDDNENNEKVCIECENSKEDVCHVHLAAILKLKDSTRKLLCLLDEIQSKKHSNNLIPQDYQMKELIKPIPNENDHEKDDCSVYKRLTKKCICLNQCEYNDFIIHFNEDCKYVTSKIGEIIKNVRILKKFLYIGGYYTKHALMFLNEGLSNSSHTEKVEISQACSHSDICNVFEDHSIVTFCISWPFKYEHLGDSTSQALAAGVLNKLALLEEGRRYLKYTSKITSDIKKVLRKKSSKLEFDTLELLNATLNLLHPPIAQNVNVTYYCKPIDEGFSNRTIMALVEDRLYMTLDEVLIHLDLLHNMSKNDKWKSELTVYLPGLLSLFKNLLMEYDNSEMNIIITKVLNNIGSENIFKENVSPKPKADTIADKTAEKMKSKETLKNLDVTTGKWTVYFESGADVKTKNETIDMSPKKITKKMIKSDNIGLAKTPIKYRQTSKGRDETRNPVIYVPIDK